MRLILLTMIFAPTLFVACKAMDDRGSLKDFNEGRPLNDNAAYLDEIKKSHPKVVIVYIANDSYTKTYANSRRNFDYLVSTLKMEASKHKDMAMAANNEADKARFFEMATKLDKFSVRILEEDARFYHSIGKDVEALKDAACRNPGYRRDPKTIGGVAIFTNSMNEFVWGNGNKAAAHQSKLVWEMCKYQENAESFVKEKTISNVLYVPEYPYSVQPFTSPDNIRRALDSVREEFEKNAEPNEKFRYVLIVKSHGSRDRVVVPLLSRDLVEEKVTPEDIVKAVTEASVEGNAEKLGGPTVNKMDNPILSVNKMDNPILASLPVITQLDIALQERAKEKNKNYVKPDIGYKKIDFLTDMASSRMQLPITIWYSCQSALEYAMGTDSDSWILRDTIINSKGNETKKINGEDSVSVRSYSNIRASNAGILYTTDLKGVKYNEIDFTQLLDSKNKYLFIPDLQDAIKALLDDLKSEK